MSFFAAVADTVAGGIAFGKDAASAGLSNLASRARDMVGSASAYVAGKGAGFATKKERRDKILQQLDKRDRFKNKVCQECNSRSRHPNANDGRYMGAGCGLSDTRPAKGVEPPGCEGAKQFPKVTFTNGINNTEAVVCQTIRALAKSQCVEVVAVFNATYQDTNIVPPDRALADYRQAGKDGLEGALKGAAMGAATGAIAGPAGAAAGAAKGAAKGAVTGAAPGVLLQEASRSGVVQDVVDCVDNINGTGAEAAAETLKNDIVASLAKDPPEKMVLYAHSQGGLINKEAIAQAEREMFDQKLDQLRASGMPPAAAKAAAKADVQARLGNLEMNSFGTLERGLPPGPVYKRYTNDRDPVPEVIKAAQANYEVPYMDADPPGSPPVHHFAASPSFNPIDAHGMLEAYLPELDKATPGRKCC